MDGVEGRSRRFLTVEHLRDLLGPSAVDLVASPRGGGAEVTGPRLYDPDDPGSVGPGEIVLAVNLPPEAAPTLLSRAGQAGASGVVLRSAQLDRLDARELATAGAAVFLASDAVTWDQLYAVIRNAANAAPSPAASAEETTLGDLFALANALAVSVGGAVSIEDPRSNLLAYSNLDQPIDDARRGTILGRRTPERWVARLEEEGFTQQLRSMPPKVVRIKDPRGETRDRLAVGVWAGAELLGIIWVVEGERPLDDGAVHQLEQAAPMAALHLLRHRSSEDLSRRERGALLESLFERRRPLGELASALHIDPAGGCAVVVFHVPVDDPADLTVTRSRAVDVIALSCESFRRQVVCALAGQTVCALFPGISESTEGRLRALVEEIADRTLDSLRVRIRAGIGPVVSGLDRVGFSRAEAERALRVVLREGSRATVAHIDDVRVASSLLEIGDYLRGRPELCPPGLQVVEQDSRLARSYLPTLRVVCEADWDISEAARRMNVHANTVRYRLRRFETVSGLSLEATHTRLLVSLYLLTNAPRSLDASAESTPDVGPRRQ